MMQMMSPGRLHLAILASGRGSNFEAILRACQQGELDGQIEVLISDQPDAAVLEKAEQAGIPALLICPADYASREAYEAELVRLLAEHGVNLVVLAGYMRLVGKTLLEAYRWRIINIHPALLPSFPGLHAQRQALEYGVKVSGCTVHFVDDGMDTGPIILQAVVPVHDNDTEESLSQRILKEEHRSYKQALQLLAQGCLYLDGRKVVVKQ